MSNDCAIVFDLWKHFGKVTEVDRNNATACCYYLGPNRQESSHIPQVYCTADGKVNEIKWDGQGLTGTIPSEIGQLVNLTYL